MASSTKAGSGLIQPITPDTAAAQIALLMDQEASAEAAEAVEASKPAEPGSDPTPTEEQAAEADSAPQAPALEGDEAPEEAPPEPPKPKTWRVKDEDGEHEVTEEELVRGYTRLPVFTRKTQALAAEKAKIEVETHAVKQERTLYAERLTALERALVDQGPREPNWDEIRQTRPEDFPAEFASWQLHKNRLDAVAREAEAARLKVEQDRVKDLDMALQRESQAMIEAIPEWKDPKAREAEYTTLMDYATSIGYRPEDLGGIRDHRLVVLLRDAARYRSLQKVQSAVPPTAKAAPVATTPTITPSAAQSSRPPVNEITRARERLAKTGKLDDAAAVILQSMA